MEGNELLLARARKGDPAAFEELMTPLERGVYFTCLRLMGDAATAQDCAQEAMIRAYKNLKSFRGECQLSTWLYRIAYAACVDEMRRQKRRPQESLENLQAAGFAPPDRGDTPVNALEKKERMAALNAAIQALPPEMKEVLVLSQLQGKSYEEVALITGAAIGTVKSRLSRAREKLKQLLSPNGELFENASVQINERRAAK